MNTLQDKTCVITGSTSGIGRAAAITLGREGSHIIVVGRNVFRGKRVADRIERHPINGKATFIECDLSSQKNIIRLSETIKGITSSVDVLINNAGAAFDNFQLSDDGVEMSFATNHLSHFMLTAHLFELLQKPLEARVINVSGGSSSDVGDHFEWLLDKENYNRKIAKTRSKLANFYFSYDLSERLGLTGIRSNAVYPGAVATNWGRNNGLFAWMRHIGSHVLKGNLISSHKGADTIVYLATSPTLKGVTGKCFYKRRAMESFSATMNKRGMKELWELSVRMTSLNKDIGKAWKYFKPLFA